MGFVFNALTWVAGWAAMAILALCIAAGLYLACDAAEENCALMRRLLHRSTLAIAGLYVLFIADGLPVGKSVFGAASHLALLPLLRTFPFVEIVSVPPILAVLMTGSNHFMWFHYFIQNADISGMSMIGFFLIFVWGTPLGFFVSLMSAEECLPGGASPAGMAGMPSANGAFSSGNKKRRNIFKSIVDVVLARKDEVVQNVAPGVGKQY